MTYAEQLFEKHSLCLVDHDEMVLDNFTAALTEALKAQREACDDSASVITKQILLQNHCYAISKAILNATVEPTIRESRTVQEVQP